MTNLSIFAAFIAGVLSFFSPCVLPLIPSYILYITGITLKDYSAAEGRIKAIIHSLFFIFGFSVVFVVLGATASLIGQALFQYKDLMRIFGGIIVILFGLYIMGILKLRFLDLERRLNLKSKPMGYLGSFLVGITFATAWVPCVGPILGGILVLASTAETISFGVILLSFYSLGLGVPFLLAALFLNFIVIHLNKVERFMSAIRMLSGALLIIIGVLLLTNYFQAIVNYFL